MMPQRQVVEPPVISRDGVSRLLLYRGRDVVPSSAIKRTCSFYRLDVSAAKWEKYELVEARESSFEFPPLGQEMAHQPLPYAKRQKITSDRPLLDPPAPRQPQFYEVQRAEPATSSSHASTRSSSHKQRVRSNVHGNFVGYYTRRRGGEHADCASAGDPRLALMPREWFEGKKVLDIGCNAGVVTVEMAQRMGAARVVGVDIDDELVRMARHHGECTLDSAGLDSLADSLVIR